MLGGGHELEATGEGTVLLEMLLPKGNSRSCALQKVLYVPKLAYNLVSVSPFCSGVLGIISSCLIPLVHV